MERETTAEQHTWNLSPLYKDDKGWEQDFKNTEGSIAEIEKHKGKLANSPQALAAGLTCYLDLSRKLEKLYCYAHLKSDEDTSHSNNLARLDRILNLFTRFSALSSFIDPEILEIEELKLNGFLQAKELADLRRTIQEIVRYKPHTLKKEEEEIIALGSEVFGSFQKIFSQLSNADLNFGELEVDGEKKTLSHGSYSLFLKHQDRTIRERAFLQYYAMFEAHKNTLAANYTSSLKKNCYLAKVKKYPSAIEKALFGDNLKRDVYEKLIETVSSKLDVLHRYYELRKNVLKLKEQRVFDTYIPLVSSCKIKLSYEEACETVLRSLAPLGQEYCEILSAGLCKERWVDVFETKGKRSGAYSSGCYDSAPYILLNYKAEDLNSVYTLTHEAGHSMHSYFSRKEQKFQDHNYTIFVAEVASTFNEQLLTKYLLERYQDQKDMRLYLINHQIDDIKATLFRQTMFAEFEKIVHEEIEANNSLSLEDYRKIYAGLLGKYFGKAVEIGELDSLECFRIPHFYSAFYVYKYATGLSAAIALSENVLGEQARGESTRERTRYLNFLKAGGSKHALELLKDAGVDMQTGEATRQAISVFERLLDELEAML